MKLGIIGCGNMGKAIAAGAINSNALNEKDLFIKDHSTEATEAAASFLNANACASIEQILTQTNTILLGVKPQMVSEILDSICASKVDVSQTLFISIAAGVKIETLEAHLPHASKVIRTMPNTPTLVAEGMIAYSPNSCCTASDEATLHHLLEGSAAVTKISEHLMDAVTGLSGSGPAYVYMFIEALADGAVKEGLARNQALELAAKTVLGSAKMVIETGLHPASLRDQVTSPGGTTIAGLAALEEHGMRNAAIKAVQAATSRAKELG